MAFIRVILTALFVLDLGNILPCDAGPIDTSDPNVCDTPVCEEAAQTLLKFMDPSVDPCDDFFQYACGGFFEKYPIPDEKLEYSAAAVYSDQLSDHIADLLKTAANEDHPKPVSDAALLFEGCMDEETREADGLDSLKAALGFIGGWPLTNPAWTDAGNHWQTQIATIIRNFGGSAIIAVAPSADSKESSRNIITVTQSPFGLERSQLVNLTSSERNEEIIAAYKDYIISTAKILNPDADETELGKGADEMIEFESALAQASRTKEERKDPISTYNKMSVAEMDRITQNTYFKWSDFLNNVFEDFPLVTDDTNVILQEIEYVKKVLKLAHDTDPRILANYIGWIWLKTYGVFTTKGFRAAEFQFKQITDGIEKPPELQDVCSEMVIERLGFAVARLYVNKYFTDEEKREVANLVEDLRSTYEITLSHNNWLDPETKRRAIEKVQAMVGMVAYPLWITNNEELIHYYLSIPIINKDKFFTAMLKVDAATVKMELAKWNHPTHRTTEWVKPPTEMNAFYYAEANSITLPAAILQLPFYQYGRPLALNYGGIGSVIGHEISHGFDDSGSKYDKAGNMVDWWSTEAEEDFDAKTSCFKLQYSSCVEPTTNTSLNGNITVGDDIADNGGVRNAFMAYKMRALQLEGEDLKKIGKLPGVSATPDQLFFLGYATMWCSHSRDGVYQWYIQNSDHTINRFRVIVPLSNYRIFAETFNCPVGSRMNPESKCVLW